MLRTVKRKEHPLSMRLPKADIAIIDRAATLRGLSRMDFMATLSGPATAVPEIVKLLNRPPPWETSGSKPGS
jgi:uncharacterized protein (DUF1778 family)